MNLNAAAGQGYAFALMAACGVVLCLVYDLLGAVRRRFDRWYVDVPCDVVFGALAVVLYFAFHYAANLLELSPFLLLAAVLGFALCKISLSKALAKALGFLYNRGKKTLRGKHGPGTQNQTVDVDRGVPAVRPPARRHRANRVHRDAQGKTAAAP